MEPVDNQNILLVDGLPAISNFLNFLKRKAIQLNPGSISKNIKAITSSIATVIVALLQNLLIWCLSKFSNMLLVPKIELSKIYMIF